MNRKLMFASDYQEGACPAIFQRMEETNLTPMPGYGKDDICEHAKDQIRKACNCPRAEVEFLIGGTQTNATVIDALLQSYQGVLAADSGHVNVHEAGAIEFGGHKVLSIPGTDGKITAAQIKQHMEDYRNDTNCEHMVMPGMVYISQPTEFGTLYNLKELSEIHEVCSQYRIPLFVDGARLAYALASPDNDVTLPDLARLCDIFYIGGTKCGALFGEAVVVPDPSLIPHFFTIIKQHGALLAKGWLLGIQFDELFRNDLYMHIGESAIQYAARIKKALVANQYQLYFDSPTNQIFFITDNDKMASLEEKVAFGFGEKYNEHQSVIRFATSWSTQEKDVDALCHFLASM